MPSLKRAKPNAIIMDFSGTAAKTGFIDKILIPFLHWNVKRYVVENWDNDDFAEHLRRMKKQNARDIEEAGEEVPKLEESKDVSQQQNSLVSYINWCLNTEKEHRAITLFRFGVWFHGVKQRKIQTPVYSDVAMQMLKWQYDMKIKLVLFSHGWVEAQSVFMTNTNHGDLFKHFDYHYDTDIGDMEAPESYNKILQEINEPPEKVCFLTKSPTQANVAKGVGINSILVLTHRREIERLSPEDKNLPMIRSFNQLEFEEQMDGQQINQTNQWNQKSEANQPFEESERNQLFEESRGNQPFEESKGNQPNDEIEANQGEAKEDFEIF